MDRSPAILSYARGSAGASLVVADLWVLPFGDASFDGIWVAASLLHLRRPEVRAVLVRFRRLLAPAGSLFVTVKEGAGERCDVAGRRFTYFRRDELSGLLRSAGFVVDELTGEEEDRVRFGVTEHIRWTIAPSRSPTREAAGKNLPAEDREVQRAEEETCPC